MTVVYDVAYVQLYCLYGTSYAGVSREDSSCILAVITILRVPLITNTTILHLEQHLALST